MRAPTGALLLVLATGAAQAQEPARAPSPVAVAPGIRGTLVLEPGRIRAGDVAVLDVVVSTPPGHALRPVAVPTALPGFWILDAVAQPVEKEDGRWIHRTRVRLRARELGQFVYPEQPVEIEAPDGSRQPLAIQGRPIEVVSVQPDFPGRSAPFGLREPPGGPPSVRGAVWPAAAAGFALGIAMSALGLLVWRARPSRHVLVSPPTRPAAAPPIAGSATHALEDAAARVASDPAAAADAAATALRRFAAPGLRAPLGALTTREIAALPAARAEAEASRGELVAVLRELDAARFPRSPEAAGPRVAAAIARAIRLVGPKAPGDGG